MTAECSGADSISAGHSSQLRNQSRTKPTPDPRLNSAPRHRHWFANPSPEAIEQSGRHLGVGKDARPFAECEIGGDDDRGALVEPADEVEPELGAGLGE